MKTMVLASVLWRRTAAYADGGDGTLPNTFFTQLPGVVAQADVPNVSAYAQNGQGLHAYATQSSRGRNAKPSTSSVSAFRAVSLVAVLSGLQVSLAAEENTMLPLMIAMAAPLFVVIGYALLNPNPPAPEGAD